MPKLIFTNTKNSDMYYAVGVDVHDPFFYLDLGEKKYVFLDYVDIGFFEEKNKNSNIETVALNPLLQDITQLNIEGTAIQKLAYLILQRYGALETVIEVSNNLPLDLADFLRSHNAQLDVQVSLYPERDRKTSEEIRKIKESIKKTYSAFSLIENILRDSKIVGDEIFYNNRLLTSEFLKIETEKLLLERDMVCSEGFIISSGEQTVMPHHVGSGPIRPHMPIICDIFPRDRESGYFADITRTYFKGEPSAEILRIYETVLSVQKMAIESVRPGVTGKEIYDKCVQAFLVDGFHVGEKGFVHGTGHGLGLDVHELPYVNKSAEKPLEVGNVVTIEPGLYYPGIGGVRIEDDVLVTEDGCENLVDYNKELLIF